MINLHMKMTSNSIPLFLRTAVEKDHGSAGYWQFLLFIGVALSITAFPVLARILAELKLLTTSVGQTALAAAHYKKTGGF